MDDNPTDSEWTDDEFGDDFSAAVDGFRTAISGAMPSPDSEQHIVEQYEAYATVLGEAMQTSDVQQQAAERYAAYTSAVAEAFAGEQSRATLDRAVRDYVAAVRDAWASVNPDEIGAPDLASIADEIQWVATIANVVQSTVGASR